MYQNYLFIYITYLVKLYLVLSVPLQFPDERDVGCDRFETTSGKILQADLDADTRILTTLVRFQTYTTGVHPLRSRTC